MSEIRKPDKIFWKHKRPFLGKVKDIIPLGDTENITLMDKRSLS